MAVDDFLFRSLEDEPSTYLRFYSWEKPTVSIGYSQRIDKVVDLDFCAKNGLDIVRRITGGKLVLHHKEVTYSVCSTDTEIFSRKLMNSYRLISEALNKGLHSMGLASRLAEDTPPDYVRGLSPCFSGPARDEIEVQGKKIIGSAQKRMGNKFIQHGSIPLEKREELLKSVSPSGHKEKIIKMMSLSEALGKKVDFKEAVDHFIYGMSDFFRVRLVPRFFTEPELEAIQKITNERYENPGWTHAH